ncbi:MAG: hypothetical protein ACD_50C00231G0006 [uncultured bacterium]|nr:MAG: hypothetical protein ACD_50C00231G0006 [uncultured bacterium]OGH14654.1 MAG: hypothetical protein A2687_00555 [Candidatus Levybacteria bacterium RIFCSPHIGHO2_01_FULL_38_26]
MNKFDFTFILLKYRGKILLTAKENNLIDLKNFLWNFIGGVKEQNKSELETIIKLVENETGIKLPSAHFLSRQRIKDITEYFYFAELSDDNVNNMERLEGRLISFYSFSEIKKLLLTDSTKLFISKHGDILEQS